MKFKENKEYAKFERLLHSKLPITMGEAEFVKTTLLNNPSFFTSGINRVPLKENAILICKLAVDYKFNEKSDETNWGQIAAGVLLENITSADDILLLANQLSNNSIELNSETVFTLNENEQKILLWLINEMKDPLPAMIKYEKHWIPLSNTIDTALFEDNNNFHALEAFNALNGMSDART